MTLRSICQYYARAFRLDPDDLEQDIHVKLLTRGNFRDQGYSYGTWLASVVRNHCIDISRKRQYQAVHLPIEHATSSICMTSFEDRQQLAKMIISVRRRWPKRRREHAAILWMLAQGWKYDEIAQSQGLALGTVKKMIHNMRQHLGTEFIHPTAAPQLR